MPQKLLANNILDLRGLLNDQETLTLVDVQGREWRIAADLPLRTALVLLSHAQAWESGEMSPESFNATVSGMHAILKRLNPDVTKDDVLDGYSIQDMIATISFLSLHLRTKSEEPSETTSEQDKSQETPTPKRSHKKLERET